MSTRVRPEYVDLRPGCRPAPEPIDLHGAPEPVEKLQTTGPVEGRPRASTRSARTSSGLAGVSPTAP